MKSSFLDKMSLLKVLQELLRPWYKSASNHKPKRPLERKHTSGFRSYATVTDNWKLQDMEEPRQFWKLLWLSMRGLTLAKTCKQACFCSYQLSQQNRALSAHLRRHWLWLLLVSSLLGTAGAQPSQGAGIRDISLAPWLWMWLLPSSGGEVFMHPHCKPWPDVAWCSLVAASVSCTALVLDFIPTDFWNLGPGWSLSASLFYGATD